MPLVAFLVTFSFFFSARLRFSPAFSTSDFLPDSSGFSRKSTSRSTHSALVPANGQSHVSSMLLTCFKSSLPMSATFLAFSAAMSAQTNPENSRRFFLISFLDPALPKHARCSCLSSSLAALCLPILKTMFSMSPSFLPAPALILKSSGSFSLTSIVMRSTCLVSRLARPCDAGAAADIALRRGSGAAGGRALCEHVRADAGFEGGRGSEDGTLMA